MQIITIAGNVGKDAELRRTQGGDPVLGFSVAVDTGKYKSGQKRPAVWYDCSIWGKRAETFSQRITKGSKVSVSGRPTVRVHNDKAYLGVVVDKITLQGGGGHSDPARQAPGGAPAGGGFDDEIPFAPEWR